MLITVPVALDYQWQKCSQIPQWDFVCLFVCFPPEKIMKKQKTQATVSTEHIWESLRNWDVRRGTQHFLQSSSSSDWNIFQFLQQSVTCYFLLMNSYLIFLISIFSITFFSLEPFCLELQSDQSCQMKYRQSVKFNSNKTFIIFV